MKSKIFGLLAETPIHPGSGQDVGFIDLPVARETATDYPVLVGSSLKGALRDRARQDDRDKSNISELFGEQDSAGHLLIGDGRLLMLPVRSLTRSYCWVTCPHLLERFSRDLGRAADRPGSPGTLQLEPGQFLGQIEGLLFLEERQFERKGEIRESVYKLIQNLILHPDTANRLKDRLVVLHDDDFVWFARYGLSVQARNVLDEVKKTSKNLWYEETIPPDALFYSLWAERNVGALDKLTAWFDERPYLQVGGNETVGQGWFAVKTFDGGVL